MQNSAFKRFQPFIKLNTTTSNNQREQIKDKQDNTIINQTNSSSNLPNHHLPNGTFRNPWPSANSNQSHLVHIINNRIPLQLAKRLITDLKPVRTLPADLKLYSDPPYPNSLSNHPPPPNQLVSTWLGHAGYLVQFPMFHQLKSTNNSRPFRVLFDPMFSIRAGPTQWTGPKRLKPGPCHIKQIPMVDICLISHSHYDHLDFDTIKALAKRQPHLRYFVPLGLKAWFDSVSIPSDQVVELDWWQSCGPDGPASTSQKSPIMDRINCNDTDQISIRITCVPAQHSSGRSLLDQNMTLWCGWIIEQTGSNLDQSSPGSSPSLKSSNLSNQPSITNCPAKTITNPNDTSNDCSGSGGDCQVDKRCCVYFAGDTGYRSPDDRDITCPVFKEIGEKFGPIDFSMIPIWRGGSLSFVSWAGFRISDPNFLVAQHATPEDAIRIHLDVKSKHSIAIHHSCFIGNDQESLEALIELNRFKQIYNVDEFLKPNGFGVVDVGETIELDITNLTPPST